MLPAHAQEVAGSPKLVHYVGSLRCPGVHWFKEVCEAGGWRCHRFAVAEPPVCDVQRGLGQLPLGAVARGYHRLKVPQARLGDLVQQSGDAESVVIGSGVEDVVEKGGGHTE